MDRLRQALDTHHELCDAFDAYLLAETDEDAVGKRSWLAHRFINGGEKAMHALAEAARSVLGAPSIGWCQEHRSVAANVTRGFPVCEWSELNRELTRMPCRMVEASVVVGDPTTNSVQNSSFLGVDGPQEGGEG